MKFPISMLHELVETSLAPQEVGDLLTMAGFELEGIEEVEDESVLDIKVVSNRGDGLSVLGLAREVLAKSPEAKPTELYTRAANRFPSPDQALTDVKDHASVEIETPMCTRYAARVMKVENGESPEWLQKRIRQAGWRPISLLVDLTNYVMLQVGQPLHAFDLDLVGGRRIVVREARQGETLTTLNGQAHELRPGQMMICDDSNPVAVAGVMGGADSEVSENTKWVLLESAHFVNTSVRRTRNQLGMSTEASYRFERSVDPDGVVAALNRFKELLQQIQPEAHVVPGVIDVYPGRQEPKPLVVRVSRATRLLGMPVSEEEAMNYLQRLGFSVEIEDGDLRVTPPSWRPDIVREDDVIEEIGRVHGYEKIPEELIHGATTLGGVFSFDALEANMREAMIRQGFIQAISFSLREAHPLDHPRLPRIGPKNPHSPEAALLRNSLLPSLADAARRNGGKDVHFFEIGYVFTRAQEPMQCTILAALSSGSVFPAVRKGDAPPTADFFSLKGSIQDVLSAAGAAAVFIAPDVRSEADHDGRFHPGRYAILAVNGDAAGVVGQIHPDVAEVLDLSPETVLAEIDLDLVFSGGEVVRRFKHVSRNPAVRRDLSILIDKAIPYRQVEEALAGSCGDVLERQWLFDIYEGTGIPDGKHSLAIALQLRKFGENFTDEEANQVRAKAAAALEALGATLR